MTDATGETHRLGEWAADHARIYTDILYADDPSLLQSTPSGGFTVFM